MNLFEQFAIDRLLEGIPRTLEIESILLALFRSAKEGHLCCPFEGDLPEALCETNQAHPKKPLVCFGKHLYFQKNWMLETQVLEKLALLWKRPSVSPALDGICQTLNPSQIVAITQGISKNLTVFSGGPGTGKTYTAAAFIRLLAAQQECKVIITAPTGKAAAHLEAVLQRSPSPQMKLQSMTLHRLLKLRPQAQNLNSTYTIDADLVVVDEASMMDGTLLLHLLNALGPHTRLLLLGDADQLPPVDGISFFPEIAERLGHRLTQSIRMGEGMVAQVAQAILEGKSEAVERLSWISEEDRLIDWLCTLLPSPYLEGEPTELLQNLTRFRILCALRQGPFGVDALNQKILAKFLGQKKEGPFVIPILISQNNPAQELFNGTQGVLIRKAGRSTAYFLTSAGVRAIPEQALPRYETAFCLSIHKSQGSEFDEVLILLGPGSERFGKEALYTGVTRAKTKVQICAEESSFQEALVKRGNLNSGFLERMEGVIRE